MLCCPLPSLYSAAEGKEGLLSAQSMAFEFSSLLHKCSAKKCMPPAPPTLFMFTRGGSYHVALQGSRLYLLKLRQSAASVAVALKAIASTRCLDAIGAGPDFASAQTLAKLDPTTSCTAHTEGLASLDGRHSMKSVIAGRIVSRISSSADSPFSAINSFEALCYGLTSGCRRPFTQAEASETTHGCGSLDATSPTPDFTPATWIVFNTLAVCSFLTLSLASSK